MIPQLTSAAVRIHANNTLNRRRNAPWPSHCLQLALPMYVPQTLRILCISTSLTRPAAAQPEVCPVQMDTQALSPNVGQAQDCRQARRCLHDHGTIDIPSSPMVRGGHAKAYRLLASLVSERRPSSTPSSPPPSRTMPTTSDDTTSRWTRQSRSRSQRPSWRRSSSRVHISPCG